MQLLGLSLTADKAEEEYLGPTTQAGGASSDSTLEEKKLRVTNTNTPVSISVCTV